MNPTTYAEFYNLLSVEERAAAPKKLYHKGDLELLFRSPKVAVVGSRKVSDEGAERARIITKALVSCGITVVSGLAEGVDTIAHETAISCGGKTIAVLGTPLDQCTPVANKPLLSKIMGDHLAVSQFDIGAKVYPGNFPKRNKTMALISDATIIVEASENSGTKHQGWEALRLGRLLLLMENVARSPDLSWADKMMAYGAIALTRENHFAIFQDLKELSFA